MTNQTQNTFALEQLLLRSGLALAVETSPTVQTDRAGLGTVLSNLAYYGYIPSAQMVEMLLHLDAEALKAFWERLQPQLAHVTGDDRNMNAHVVYKNFPREVLKMSEADYWIRQVLMYLGLPNEFFTEDEQERAPLVELAQLKVLDLAGAAPFETIFEQLCNSGASWQPDQEAAAIEYLEITPNLNIDLGKFRHRANGVVLAIEAFNAGRGACVTTTSATDVLRIAAGLSGSDHTLKLAPRFRKFSRPERRALAQMLGQCADLAGDFGRRPEFWKRLLSRLHPGDYKIEALNAAYADLFAGSKSRLSARIENGFRTRDITTLDALACEPGTFARQLHQAYGLFGRAAFRRFVEVMDALNSQQLLKLQAYFETVSSRASFLVRPRGDWGKAQSLPNTKAPIEVEDLAYIVKAIRSSVAKRVNDALPQGVALDLRLADVKLVTNGQELATYGRGSEFDIPENITYLRSASFWAHSKRYGNTWYDNGWNFFDADWNELGACSYDCEKFRSGPTVGAVFSGDPTNSKDLEGRGCQMIDLYLDKLATCGVRYAVWSVLCYSGETFSQAEEVLATLQWGENAESGKLYEPSRAQTVFPLKGDHLTKFVAYVDIERRKLCYMDVGLNASVTSASRNGKRLSGIMPAFLDYARALPSVADLFIGAQSGSLPVLRSDENATIDGPAFVLERRSETNRVEQLDLEALLAAKSC